MRINLPYLDWDKCFLTWVVEHGHTVTVTECRHTKHTRDVFLWNKEKMKPGRATMSYLCERSLWKTVPQWMIPDDFSGMWRVGTEKYYHTKSWTEIWDVIVKVIPKHAYHLFDMWVRQKPQVKQKLVLNLTLPRSTSTEERVWLLWFCCYFTILWFVSNLSSGNDVK